MSSFESFLNFRLLSSLCLRLTLQFTNLYQCLLFLESPNCFFRIRTSKTQVTPDRLGTKFGRKFLAPTVSVSRKLTWLTLYFGTVTSLPLLVPPKPRSRTYETESSLCSENGFGMTVFTSAPGLVSVSPTFHVRTHTGLPLLLVQNQFSLRSHINFKTIKDGKIYVVR